MKKLLMSAAMAAAVLTAPVYAGAQEVEAEVTETPEYKVTVTAGVNYLNGDYGQTVDTSIVYAPVTVKVDRDNWQAKLTVPYLSITGPGVVVGGADGVGDIGTPGVKDTQSGMGDVVASLRYKHKVRKGTSVDLTGKVKLPTADEDKKLGTGKADYIAELGATQMIGKAYIRGKVGYKFTGRTDRYNLQNSGRGSIGGGYMITNATSVGATYNFRQTSSKTGTNYSQVMGYVSHKFNDDWSAQVYAATGFTDGTPDEMVGLAVSRKF